MLRMNLSVTRRHRLVAVPVTLLAAGVLLVGCGSSSSSTASPGASTSASSASSAPDSDPTSAVQSAFTSLANETSAKLSLTGSVTAGSQGGVTFSADGPVAFDGSGADITAGLTLSGAAASSIPGGSGEIKTEIKVVDKTAYILFPDIPGLESLGYAGKWIKADAGTGSSSSPSAVPSASALADAFGSATSITVVGAEDVDGVSATHYEMVIDLAQLIPEISKAAGSSSAQVDSLLAELKADPAKVGVWIDDSQRLVKATVDASATAQNQAVTFALELKLTDYGTTVEVTPPPAADVVDADELSALSGLVPTA